MIIYSGYMHLGGAGPSHKVEERCGAGDASRLLARAFLGVAHSVWVVLSRGCVHNVPPPISSGFMTIHVQTCHPITAATAFTPDYALYVHPSNERPRYGPQYYRQNTLLDVSEMNAHNQGASNLFRYSN